MYYTTWGPVRGGCGHVHRTLSGAQACLARDGRGCRRQGGYSDRLIRAIANPAEARAYDVTRGPGQPAKAVRLERVVMATEALTDALMARLIRS